MDVALAEGDFVAGRVPECDLVLDDGLVSRRHALFRVSGDRVEVEDLGSRNGVTVNGLRIDRPTLLRPGDEVRIGSQNLLLRTENGVTSKTHAGTRELRVCPRCEVPAPLDAACPRCGEGPEERDRPSAPSFDVLSRIADKAIDLGRLGEAERILNTMFESLVAQQRRDNSTKDSDVAIASECALKLAVSGRRGAWLDYSIRLHHELGRVIAPATVDALYQLASRLRYNNPAQLRLYLAFLRSQADRLDATQRFSLSRLEGLERMLASH